MCFVPCIRCSLDAFSNVLHKCCSERELLATPDVAHLLSMSVVMLNTRCAQRCASPKLRATHVLLTLKPRLWSGASRITHYTPELGTNHSCTHARE